MSHHLSIEWVPGWMVHRYARQDPFDVGELSDRQIENLRPQGNVTRRAGTASTAPPTTQRSTTSYEY